MKEYERTFQQWKELAERYFEAETTETEEEALARFLPLLPHKARSSTNFVP